MNINSLTKEDILSQIKYLEQNINNGSAAYQANRIGRIRTLKSSLRNSKTLVSVTASRSESIECLPQLNLHTIYIQ